HLGSVPRGLVPEPGGDLQDLLPRLLADHLRAPEGTRDRGHRHAGLLCDIAQRHPHLVPPVPTICDRRFAALARLRAPRGVSPDRPEPTGTDRAAPDRPFGADGDPQHRIGAGPLTGARTASRPGPTGSARRPPAPAPAPAPAPGPGQPCRLPAPGTTG